MNVTDVRFRPATPNDSKWAIGLIVDSAPHRFRYLYGGSMATLHAYLRDEFEGDGGVFSHKHHIVGEGEVPVAIASLFSSQTALLQAIWSGLRMLRSFGLMGTAAILKRRLLASGTSLPLSLGCAYFDNLCVDPEFRGIGIGAQIMAYLGRVAAERGCHELYCDVEVENLRALRFYERCNMHFVALLRSSKSSEAADLVRLRAALSTLRHCPGGAVPEGTRAPGTATIEC